MLEVDRVVKLMARWSYGSVPRGDPSTTCSAPTSIPTGLTSKLCILPTHNPRDVHM